MTEVLMGETVQQEGYSMSSELGKLAIEIEGPNALIVATMLRGPLNELNQPSKFGKGLSRPESSIMAEALKKLRRIN